MEKNHLKKYRLIREYPGSPKLNTIFDYWTDGISEQIYNKSNNPSFIPLETVHQYPEFWKEVVEKDYEILEIHYKSDNEDTIVEYSNGIAVKRNDNFSIEDTCTLKELNKTDWEKYITITKIKRLSDNQIFKLGDLISDGNQEGKILRLRVTNNGLFQFSCSEKNGWCEFDNYNIIIKKDYEILSLLGNDNKVIPYITKTECIDFLIENGFKIYSVKRNDGEIFTIGDRINQGVIENIIIKKDKIYLEI